MGSGFSKMKKQAKEFQKQMAEMQQQLEKVEVEGSSGGGLVKLLMNGEKKVKKVTINPECVDPKDVDGLEDLILAAFEDGLNRLEEKNPSSGQTPFGF